MGTRIIVTEHIRILLQLKIKYYVENLDCKQSLYYLIIQICEILMIFSSDKHGKETNFLYVRNEMPSLEESRLLLRLRNLLVHNTYKLKDIQKSFLQLSESSIIMEALDYIMKDSEIPYTPDWDTYTKLVIQETSVLC